MATWAIGDLQGCREPFERLLEAISFDPAEDRLWLAGDLVNRGDDSAGCLRRIRELGPAAVVVLGNHDIHLLGMACGTREPRPSDTARQVLDEPDAHELLEWLAARPLLHREGEHVLMHAGLSPDWTVEAAERLAAEAAAELRGPRRAELLAALWAAPSSWSDELSGLERHACVVSLLTRLRMVDASGAADHDFSGHPDDAPDGLVPWFDAPGRRSTDSTLVFAHWSALGLLVRPREIALDTGCVWGRQLTAVQLAVRGEDRRVVQVSCEACG